MSSQRVTQPEKFGRYTNAHDPLDILNAIVAYKRTHDGNSPSYEWLMRECGVSSKSVLRYNLGRLQKLGRIQFAGVRGIMVTGGCWTLQEQHG